jgi:hypothetical protein
MCCVRCCGLGASCNSLFSGCVGAAVGAGVRVAHFEYTFGT